uniref:Uncharacterized protein n=1 Tax=Trichogramma kaykai TaxID=54128 RepID=A0ABD2WHI6_9HYME
MFYLCIADTQFGRQAAIQRNISTYMFNVCKGLEVAKASFECYNDGKFITNSSLTSMNARTTWTVNEAINGISLAMLLMIDSEAVTGYSRALAGMRSDLQSTAVDIGHCERTRST